MPDSIRYVVRNLNGVHNKHLRQQPRSPAMLLLCPVRRCTRARLLRMLAVPGCHSAR